MDKNRVGFLDKEDVTDAANYFWNDILAPRVSDLIQDLCEDILDAIKSSILDYVSISFGGSARSYTGRTYRLNRSVYSYGSSRSNRSSKSGRIKEILFESRVEADDVIDELKEVDADGFVSINDYYDIIGEKTSDYTDDDFGWTSTRNIRVRKVDDGYSLVFPRPVRR